MNAGIGGNQVTGPAEYARPSRSRADPRAGQRLERDVLSLSGRDDRHLAGGHQRLRPERQRRRRGGPGRDARRGGTGPREAAPGALIGATLTSALGSTSPAHGFAEQDAKRQALNDFIRTSGLFDAVAEFDAATLDPATGGLRPEMVPDSTAGGEGTSCIPTGPDTWRWATRLTWICSSRARQAGVRSRRSEGRTTSFHSSCPALCRASTSFLLAQKGRRGWPGHRRAKRRRSSNGYARP